MVSRPAGSVAARKVILGSSRVAEQLPFDRGDLSAGVSCSKVAARTRPSSFFVGLAEEPLRLLAEVSCTEPLITTGDQSGYADLAMVEEHCLRNAELALLKEVGRSRSARPAWAAVSAATINDPRMSAEYI